MKVASCVLMVLLLVGTVACADQPGEKLFNRKCAMCHKVRGRGGEIGPDLSKVGSRLSLTQLQTKIAYPRKASPGSTMPSFATLAANEMQELLNYLKTLK